MHGRGRAAPARRDADAAGAAAQKADGGGGGHRLGVRALVAVLLGLCLYKAR
jgi:hypothetical protein